MNVTYKIPSEIFMHILSFIPKVYKSSYRGIAEVYYEIIGRSMPKITCNFSSGFFFSTEKKILFGKDIFIDHVIYYKDKPEHHIIARKDNMLQKKDLVSHIQKDVGEYIIVLKYDIRSSLFREFFDKLDILHALRNLYEDYVLICKRDGYPIPNSDELKRIKLYKKSLL